MSAATINTATLLKTIASLEAQLHELTAAIAGADGMPAMAKKMTKPKDPDAPKKEPNVWIKFTQHVGALLKAAAAEDGADPEHFKGPATMVKEFCSMLKEQKGYTWSDSEVLEAFESWERPVHEPRAKKSSAAGSVVASEAGSESGSDGVTKTRKKPEPKTEEQKAAIAAKRAATIAAKKAASA